MQRVDEKFCVFLWRVGYCPYYDAWTYTDGSTITLKSILTIITENNGPWSFADCKREIKPGIG